MSVRLSRALQQWRVQTWQQQLGNIVGPCNASSVTYASSCSAAAPGARTLSGGAGVVEAEGAGAAAAARGGDLGSVDCFFSPSHVLVRCCCPHCLNTWRGCRCRCCRKGRRLGPREVLLQSRPAAVIVAVNADRPQGLGCRTRGHCCLCASGQGVVHGWVSSAMLVHSDASGHVTTCVARGRGMRACQSNRLLMGGVSVFMSEHVLAPSVLRWA